MDEIKRSKGFKSHNWVTEKSQIRKAFSPNGDIYSHQESSSSNTLFHKVNFGIRKVFGILSGMVSNTIEDFLGVMFASFFGKTVFYFMQIRDRGYKGRKKEAMTAVELTDEGKVKRM